MRFIYLLLISTLIPFGAQAQDTGSGDRFQPPAPPPLNPATDFDDLDEDMMEMGDDGNFRPPPPPIPQPGANAGPGGEFQPPMPMGGGGSGNGMPFSGHSSLGKDKVRFEVVPNEYYQRGKKRGRGEKLRARSSGN